MENCIDFLKLYRDGGERPLSEWNKVSSCLSRVYREVNYFFVQSCIFLTSIQISNKNTPSLSRGVFVFLNKLPFIDSFSIILCGIAFLDVLE